MRRGVVKVWTIDLTLPTSLVDRAIDVLDDEERSRAARFRFACDRDAFISRRAAYRIIMGKENGLEPQSIRYRSGRLGKLELDHPVATKFSTSRSGKWAVLAVALVEVGVDVESIQWEEDFSMLSSQCLSKRERDIWAGLGLPAQVTAFYRAWVRKEAVSKAIGCGLRVDPRSLDVWRPLEGVRHYTAFDNSTWQLIDLDVPMGEAACVAVKDDVRAEQLGWSWPGVSSRPASERRSPR
jgi:4'-phosphopantetheinyl transferase